MAYRGFLEETTMRRCTIVFIVALGILSAALAADARQPVKVPRIGVLLPGSPPGPHERSPGLEAFQQGLRDLGYVEGQNLVMESRWAEGKFERLPDLAVELVRLKADVIVTVGTPAIQAAKRATETLPIVMVGAGDPLGTGLIASLAHPGGNITGLATQDTDLSGKRLELLKEAVPTLSRIAVLWNSASASMKFGVRAAQAAAEVLGMTFISLEVHGNPEDFERAFAAVSQERPDALYVTFDPFTFRHQKRIVELAAAHRLPAIYARRQFVDAGGLMSYAPRFPDMWRRAATYVDKILKGAKPATLPVEQPMRFEFVLNLKTAAALGLTLPPHILVFADEVIR
jgi:putative ABC transport system substrate-binding protein